MLLVASSTKNNVMTSCDHVICNGMWLLIEVVLSSHTWFCYQRHENNTTSVVKEGQYFSTIHVYYFSSIHAYYFSTIHVYYFSTIHVYYFSTIRVYYLSTIHVYYFSTIRVSDNSVSVYSILLLVYHTQMVTPGNRKAPGSRRKRYSYNFFKFPPQFSRLLSYLVGLPSLCLLLQLALHEGHVYCLWPLPHLLLVCTTVVCVLSPMSTISVYNCSMCTVCGHYHVYNLLLVCTTVVWVLFVATPMYTIYY